MIADWDKRITPDNVQSLKKNEYFVFGSNLQGLHGGGAAATAFKNFKAEWTVGVGITGKCYAIPTVNFSNDGRNILSTKLISDFISDFIYYAKYTRANRYLVTEIGCGIAGYKPEDIAPLFRDAMRLHNIYLPKRFWEILNKTIYDRKTNII